MKNRQFRFMSLDEKQNILLYVLRDRTKNELTIQEETQILSAVSSKTQFHIKVYVNADKYLKAISSTKEIIEKVILGTVELDGMKAFGTIPENAIAIISKTMDGLQNSNQVHIYIPPNRKYSSDCIKEKFSYKHLRSKETKSISFNLRISKEIAKDEE